MRSMVPKGPGVTIASACAAAWGRRLWWGGAMDQWVLHELV